MSPSPAATLTTQPPATLPTSLVGQILQSPGQFTGQDVEIVGFFHGWDELHEMAAAPPVTRSDWVIADAAGAIYVTGALAGGLDPASDSGTLLRLGATVRSSPDGQVYLEARNVDVLGTWTVKFTLSGGFAGLNREMELSSSGRLDVTDQKRNKQVTFQLTGEDIKKIQGLIATAVRFPQVNELPACADCYLYGLSIQMTVMDFSASLNDINLSKSGLAPLINGLKDLQERALSGAMG
jgi:hypothetical protein